MDLRAWVYGQDEPVRTTLARLARESGVSVSAVKHWMYGIRRVSAERCRVIERLTSGAVTAEELRPDVFTSPHRSEAAKEGGVAQR